MPRSRHSAAPAAAWPAPDTAVLVAVVTRPADLARAADGWYRLPVAHAPPRLGCEALAFYQTGAFGPDGHAVRLWAAVERVSLARRRELLPDEAQHPRADALYYRFALGPLVALARPIPARRLRRVTFIPTTWARLAAAQDVADLWLRPPSGAPLPTAGDDEDFSHPSRIIRRA
ncbi:MAG: hypothetical protein U0768_16215 [Anaerolineae bacterium]